MNFNDYQGEIQSTDLIKKDENFISSKETTQSLL